MKGFTLIEMLVSVAIFATVMTIALGSLLSLSSANRKALSLKSALDNVNFALDSMARSLRTGTHYDCAPAIPAGGFGSGNPPVSTDCPAGAGELSYLDTAGNAIDLLLAAPCTVANTACIMRSKLGGASGTYLQITDPGIVIETLKFYVKGAPLNDGLQPRVTLLVGGYIQVSDTQRTSFNLQTSVTQRLYDQ